MKQKSINIYLRAMQNITKSQERTELHGTHVSSPNFLITTCFYNTSQEYFLTEGHDFQQHYPMSYVDYNLEDTNYLSKNLFSGIQEDRHGFAISELESTHKYSLDYFNCTGIVAIGISKETGENISILTHQDPVYFLSNKSSKLNHGYTKKSYFEERLTKILGKLKEECVEGSVDIVILGGNNNDDLEQYKSSIELLSQNIYNIMGFYPVIIGGPSINEEKQGCKGIFVDTKNRRIYYYKKYNDVKNNIISVSNKINELLKNNSENNSGLMQRIKRLLKR